MSVYKRVVRYYFDSWDQKEPEVGAFIARGQWADGHLAYTRFDEDGYEIDECSYVQLRGFINGKSCLYMQRI